MPASLRVGVLTGGGDCPGLNAVIRAVTKSLILQHHAEVIGIEDGYLGLIERRIRFLTYRDTSGILTRGGTILGSSNIANPFSYYKRGHADVSEEVVAYAQTIGMDALVVIGGDGTMSIANRLANQGMHVVGVPKTIDNDLMETERTFGFDTAVSIVTEAIDRLHTTAQSHDRVMIVETMGRYAGWIALYAGIAGGADVILIPEIEYDVRDVADVCRRRERGGQHFTIVVIAEGARPQDGDVTVGQVVKHSPDPVRLGGVGKVLESTLSRLVQSEVRTTILGHMQRGGTPTAYDRDLATVFGAYAASLVADGQFGRMVAMQNNRLTSVPFEAVADKTRTVPLDHPMIATAHAVGTSFGVRDFDQRLDGARISHAVT